MIASTLLLAASAATAPMLGTDDAQFDCLFGERPATVPYAELPPTYQGAFTLTIRDLKGKFDDGVENVDVAEGDYLVTGDWVEEARPDQLNIGGSDQILLFSDIYQFNINEPLTDNWSLAAAFTMDEGPDYSAVCHAKLGWDADFADYNPHDYSRKNGGNQ